MLHTEVARGLRASMRNNGQAYGFSVSITAGLALLTAEVKRPGPGNILLFALGAVVAFSVLEALASGGFRKTLEEEPSNVTALGVSMSFLSVGSATLAAWGTAHFVGGVIVWPLTGFVVATIYPVLAGLELALAERARESSDSRSDEEREEGRGAGE
jgi:hypothetical protein